jgi:hypothetical protein
MTDREAAAGLDTAGRIRTNWPTRGTASPIHGPVATRPGSLGGPGDRGATGTDEPTGEPLTGADQTGPASRRSADDPDPRDGALAPAQDRPAAG